VSHIDMYGGRRSADRGKQSKVSVNYSPVSTDRTRCDGCRHFQSPHSCELVMGDIAPAGWCKLWAAKK